MYFKMLVLNYIKLQITSSILVKTEQCRKSPHFTSDANYWGKISMCLRLSSSEEEEERRRVHFFLLIVHKKKRCLIHFSSFAVGLPELWLPQRNGKGEDFLFCYPRVASAVKDSVTMSMMNSGYTYIWPPYTEYIFFLLFGPSVFYCILDENYVLIAVYFFINTIGYICAAKRRRGLLSPSRFRTTWTKFSGKKNPVEVCKDLDQITIKRPNPKCRLYSCLTELVDRRYNHACIFDP
jgi:hypothetical protein